MRLSEQFKHEMAKAFVQATLKAAGYRVIASELEQVVREVTLLGKDRYKALAMPPVIARLPDYVVLDEASTTCSLVEVAYRAVVTDEIKQHMLKRANELGEVTFVLVDGGVAKPGSDRDLGGVVRCCRLHREQSNVMIDVRDTATMAMKTVPLAKVPAAELWTAMLPLCHLFPQVVAVEAKLEAAVETAARAFAA